MVFGPDGRVEREITSAVPSFPLWMRQLVPWLALAGLVLCFVGTLAWVYLAIFNRRVALVLKLVLTIVPLVVLSIVFISNSVFTKTLARVEEELLFRLSALAQAAAGGIDGDAVDRIRVPSDYLGDDYTAVAEALDRLVNSGSDPWNQRIFANVAKLYNGMFYIMADYASSYGVLYPMPHAPFERYGAALATGEMQRYEYTDADGTYLEAAAPVRNGSGETVAVLYVGSSKDDLVLLQQAFRSEVTRDTAIAAVALSAVIAAVSVFLLLSIRQLQRAVGRMQGGAYETRVTIRRRDEIGDLGKSFNVMGDSLQGSFRQITTMRDAYARYVPREFLRLLGKREIHEIELGNQVEVDMAVLFADIRSFTMLSEGMKPQENFNFLNSYLSRMGPIIRANHGFIDKYLGDGIMALFAGDRPDDPTGRGQDPARASADAVAAATAMQQELFTYNRQRRRMGYQPIQVGVGVHAGKVMLGILGEEERREGTVIADVVNLASRLEGLTKVYGARIIVSDQVIRMLGPAPRPPVPRRRRGQGQASRGAGPRSVRRRPRGGRATKAPHEGILRDGGGALPAVRAAPPGRLPRRGTAVLPDRGEGAPGGPGRRILPCRLLPSRHSDRGTGSTGRRLTSRSCRASHPGGSPAIARAMAARLPSRRSSGTSSVMPRMNRSPGRLRV